MTDAVVDLRLEPVIDNHCHRPVIGHADLDSAAWRTYLSESNDDVLRADEVQHTAMYRRLLGRLCGFLDCPAEEAAVLEARRRRGTAKLTEALLKDAGIGLLMFDEGFPRDKAMSNEDLAASGPFRSVSILRVETLFEEVIAQSGTLEEVEEAVDERLFDVRDDGFVALKTVIAYRTGLVLDQWARDDVRHAFKQTRDAIAVSGACRLTAKPLADALLTRALQRAAEQELAVQVHTGYGDSDIDLRLANPLHTRAWLADPGLRGARLVLLHGCYPYTREGAYLASVYGNIYLDVSYAVPHASMGELLEITRQALGLAPASRVLYSSDAYCIPELHWMSAHDGRWCLQRVLSEQAAAGDLDPRDAVNTGRAVLSGNASRIYGVSL